MDALVSILEELSKLYSNLFDLLLKEKSNLILAELDKISESNKTKEALLYKIRACDRTREKRAKELAISLGVDADKPRLLSIAEKVTAEEALLLRNLHQTLSMQIQRVQELNDENEQYTESALGLLNGAMRDIKHTVSGKNTYGKKGQMAQSNETQSGNFVSKEV